MKPKHLGIILAVTLLLPSVNSPAGRAGRDFGTASADTSAQGNADRAGNNGPWADELKWKVDSLSWSIEEAERSWRTDFATLADSVGREEARTQKQISDLEEKQLRLERRIAKVATAQRELADSLRRDLDTLRWKDTALSDQQKTIADSFDKLARATDQELSRIGRDLVVHRVLIGLVILVSLVALFTAVMMFRKKREREELVAEGLELNAKICDLLDNQLKLMKQMDAEPRPEEKQPDHALAIRVGIEIYRMRKGIGNMDPELKGLNALKHALTHLEEEFSRQGYVINDLTGQPYLREFSMKVKKSNVTESVKPGRPTIEKMITPQVLHQGDVVYGGEVEIAISPKDK